ncbi:unnamed protein product [Absidia cylindrospora]
MCHVLYYMIQPVSNVDTNANYQMAAYINDALLTNDTNSTTINNTTRQRERSQTVTQNDIQPSSLHMNIKIISIMLFKNLIP